MTTTPRNQFDHHQHSSRHIDPCEEITELCELVGLVPELVDDRDLCRHLI